MKSMLSRRAWLTSLGVGVAAARAPAGGATQATTPPTRSARPVPPAAGSDTLLLKDFQPRSMLVVPETPVARARFPVVDVHTHPTFRARIVAGVPHGEAVRAAATPADLLAIMERNRAFRDDSVRKGLLALFQALGDQDPLAAEGRRKLANLLF